MTDLPSGKGVASHSILLEERPLPKQGWAVIIHTHVKHSLPYVNFGAQCDD